jgi:small basic protein
MGWLALFAGIIGFVSVYYSNVSIPFGYASYISLAALAGLDSLIGGIRAAQNRQFSGMVFVSGFVANALLAAFLVYFGDALGQNLALAAVVSLGWRIFTNLSIIRRHWLEEHWRQGSAGDSDDGGRASNRVQGGHAHEPVV